MTYQLRRRPVALLLALVSLGAFAPAQLRDRSPQTEIEQPKAQKPKKRGPRAIGVLEFLPGGGTRLVPVALWIDGRYYDASIYAANPEPMALESGTMYQVMSFGEPTGWFTVTLPKQIKGNWVADGRWKPEGALDRRMAEEAAKQPKPKSKPPSLNDDQGPPVLRRSGAGDSTTASQGSEGTPAPSAGASSSNSPAAQPDANSPPKQADDPDRPTLKAPPAASADSSRQTLGTDAPPASMSPPPSSSGDENDPNRPVLTRGKQPPSSDGTQPTGTTQAGIAAPTKSTTAKGAGGATGPEARAYPAISDAGDYETRPMLYPMTPAEREEKARSLLPMAMDEIRNFASKRNTPPPPKTANIATYDVRAFDLDFSNSPTLVLTAELPVSGKTVAGAKPSSANAQAPNGPAVDYFVTLVARLDFNGQPIKIFSSVTDSNHLDAFPRLEVIDAVDADANGRGMLLFRQYADGTLNYGLYRVFPYQMVKVFEGGAGL